MTSKRKILVIDDSLNIRKLIKVIIQKIGDYECIEAANGHEGLDKALKHKPDLIIQEWILKGDLKAVELCRRVKAERDVPVIVLTSETTGEAVEQARQVGADIFMGKPFEPRHLRESVKELLG
jgi:DNA-binding response OmpR family regulator